MDNLERTDLWLIVRLWDIHKILIFSRIFEDLCLNFQHLCVLRIVFSINPKQQAFARLANASENTCRGVRGRDKWNSFVTALSRSRPPRPPCEVFSSLKYQFYMTQPARQSWVNHVWMIQEKTKANRVRIGGCGCLSMVDLAKWSWHFSSSHSESHIILWWRTTAVRQWNLTWMPSPSGRRNSRRTPLLEETLGEYQHLLLFMVHA